MASKKRRTLAVAADGEEEPPFLPLRPPSVDGFGELSFSKPDVLPIPAAGSGPASPSSRASEYGALPKMGVPSRGSVISPTGAFSNSSSAAADEVGGESRATLTLPSGDDSDDRSHAWVRVGRVPPFSLQLYLLACLVRAPCRRLPFLQIPILIFPCCPIVFIGGCCSL